MPLAEEAKSIGLLGGTFDPVHKGHVGIINSFLQSGFLEHLVVLLTPKPPHKNGKEFAGYDHRLQMLKLALKGMAHVEISTIERELPDPSYTVNTINYFREQHPGLKLYLCLGEDSLKEFKSWYHWEEILQKCSLLVARRPDMQDTNIPADLKQYADFVDHEPIDISSTEIRNRLKKGEAVTDKLPADVIAYIQQNNLYT